MTDKLARKDKKVLPWRCFMGTEESLKQDFQFPFLFFDINYGYLGMENTCLKYNGNFICLQRTERTASKDERLWF